MSNAKVEEFKSRGNAALQAGNANDAIKAYSEAIALDPTNHLLYSNRSAAHIKAEAYEEALIDADKCVELRPGWAKAYSRKGAALELLGRDEEAAQAYQAGLKQEPSNAALTEAVDKLQAKVTASTANGDATREAGKGISSMFSDPQLWEKLRAHEATRSYAEDPAFKLKIDMIKSNPQLLGSMLQDEQIMSAMAVMMNLDPGQIKLAPNPPSSSQNNKMEVDPQDKKGKKNTINTEKEPQKKEPETPEERALTEKELGNAAYKQKRFEEALAHYNAAIALDPLNCTFLSNKAAVHFERGEFDECIRLCEAAVELGRDQLADFKTIGRCLARIGNAHLAQENLEAAKSHFQQSLAEFRQPEIVRKLAQVEKTLKERARLSYIDVDLAEQEKQRGNEAFKRGAFPDAMKHYDEAILRNPDDARIYSNRAACLTKLMEFGMALRDCDTCIRLDPQFAKGYLRKAAIHATLKENTKAAEAYRKALEIDPNCREAQEGLRNTTGGFGGGGMMGGSVAGGTAEEREEARKRAMQDPEIQAIIGDPAMQIILSQMQSDPNAFREHLQNPDIAVKLHKLMEAGFIAIR